MTTTPDEYIDRVLFHLPEATPQRAQIAMELRVHIAERLGFGRSLDEIVRQLGDPLKLAESYLAALPLKPAPLWSRVRAKLLDIATVMLVMLPFALAGWMLLPEWLVMFVPVAFLAGGSIVFAIYTGFTEHQYGQTLGKHLMGLRVVRESGARISLGQSLVRQLPMVLQVFWIDALFALFTDKRQRAFELLSKTRTVRAPRPAA